MKFKDYKTSDDIVSEIDRICGSAVNSYSYKDKAARLNAALFRYFMLAYENDSLGSFDDKNHTSLPVEAQSLVAGTNNYKFSAFTNEIINMLRLAILDDDGNEHTLEHEILSQMNEFYELYNTDSDKRGTPNRWARMGDYIYVRLCPDYAKADGLRAYVNRVPHSDTKFTFTAATVTIATPGVFSATAHGLAADDTVILNTDGALPTGSSEDTVYYVISTGLTTDAFQLSATLGGSGIATTGSQSGNHQFIKLNSEPGIPTIHHPYLARHASLPFLIEKKLPQAGGIAQQIMLDERDIRNYFAQRDKDIRKQITVKPIQFR